MRTKIKFSTPILRELLTMLAISCCSVAGVAQDGTDSAAVELINPRLTFVCIQKSDQTIELRITAKSKVKNSFSPLDGLTFRFSNTTEEEPKVVGEGVTDMDGVTSITINSKDQVLDEEGKMRFIAQFAGNEKVNAGEEEVYIKKARMEIVPTNEDSTLSIQVVLVDESQSEEARIAETDIGVFVKRTFNPLKVGEGASDENGELIVEFPADLPGDDKGNLTVIARVEDTEDYGNLEATAVVQWGITLADKATGIQRELWSPHPPLWMLITFFVLMTAVWGHYIVIVYKLIKLGKPKIENV